MPRGGPRPRMRLANEVAIDPANEGMNSLLDMVKSASADWVQSRLVREGGLHHDERGFQSPIQDTASIASLFRSYGTILSHSSALDLATTATTSSVSLMLNTSCGTPGSMKMKSPASFSTTC